MKLLIVDDVKPTGQAFARLARGLGWSVSCVTRVKTARRERGFDAAIVDVNVQGESGLELLAHLRSKEPRAAYLVLTGDPRVSIAAHAAQLGATYLRKPIGARTLRLWLMEVEAGGGRGVQERALGLDEMETWQKQHFEQLLLEFGATHGLSERHIDIIRLTAHGLNRSEIAEKLDITLATYQKHVGRLQKRSHTKLQRIVSELTSPHLLDE